MTREQFKEKIKLLSEKYFQEFIAVRRHLHTIPEMGYKEYKTSGYIIKKLSEFGIPYQRSVAVTGVVGSIHGRNAEKKTIALRTDMDALPIKEENKVKYKSKNKNMMHACGHDAHMACVLGAAKILNELRNEFEGTVKLIFQPSEEAFPGGAIKMIQEGVLENPHVSNVFGQHVYPSLETGKVGFRPGKYMASTDEIYITVFGKGGHAATPDLFINPLMIASKMLTELEKYFNDNKPSNSLSVLTFGRIIGEGKTNIVPDKVMLEGTFRAFDEDWRIKAHEGIKRTAAAVAESSKGKCDVRIDRGYPFLENDAALTAEAKKLAEEYLGEENVVDLEMRMTAEDFAYFAQAVPSVFYRFGVRNESKKITSNLHTSTFDLDEDSLKIATGLMVWIAVNQF